MVIHPNKVRVRMKSDRWWSRLKRHLTLESQVVGVPDGGTQETYNERLNGTTNVEGDESSREEVSSKRLIFGFILQLSNWFLVSLDSSTSSNARFSF
jgi:hypothetical protein